MPRLTKHDGPSSGALPTQRAEIGALTGIRAFAAIGVVAFHTAHSLPSYLSGLYWVARLGYLGVDLFFVLSGFIISYNYWPNSAGLSAAAYKRFLGLRLARLYPVHGCTLLLTAFLMLGSRVTGINLRNDFSTWTAPTFLSNVVLVHAWAPHRVDAWNGVSWSVSCEWFAYLTFPLLCLIPLRRVPAVVGMALATMSVAIPAAIAQTSSNLAFVPLVKVSCEFVAGCLASHAYYRRQHGAGLRGQLGSFVVALLAGLIAVLWVYKGIAPDWIAVCFPALILGIAWSSGLIKRVLESRPALYWGRVSYSLYMTHYLAIWPVKSLIPIPEHASSLTNALMLTFYLSVTAGVAAATYHFVEEPSRRWLRRRFGRATLASHGPAVCRAVGAGR